MFFIQQRKVFYRSNFVALWQKSIVVLFYDICKESLTKTRSYLVINRIGHHYVFLTSLIQQVFIGQPFLRFLNPLALLIASFDLDNFTKEVSKYINIESHCSFVACRVYESFAFSAPRTKELYSIVELYYVHKSKTIYVFTYKLLLKLYFFFSYFISYLTVLPIFYAHTNASCKALNSSAEELVTSTELQGMLTPAILA